MAIISVIIPAYNAERTILETISSVQQQTFSDFELIVINDGSTDRTLELLNSIEDPRLKVFSYSNGGLPVARNRGISHATGEFIAFIDADDLWTPDKLELQLAALQQHPEAGVAYSWTCNMSEEGELLYPVTPVFNGNVYANLLVWNFISNGSNPLIRSQALKSTGEFDPTLKSAEDWEYWLRLAAHWPFVVVPNIQILYRRSSNSMTSKIEIIKQASLIVLERAFGNAPPELQYLKKQGLANIYQYYAEVYLRDITNNNNELNKVMDNLWKAVYLQPQNLLNKYTQRLVVKVLLLRVLSPGIASNIFRFISKIRTNRQHLLQQSESI
ncbi:putative glycosyl transferase [Calothrix sp. NIES-4071]|nr:putative glycosyl transferase [Calothrix sp. NIES-4071]BAZ59450.1 putative glycosyl transferase [Calothrix sp. NIES-4105]